MRASRCHFTRSWKFVGSMPVERSSTSIHCSSVKARRPSNNSSMSMFGIWIGFKSRRTNGDPFWSSSKKYSSVTMHQMPPTSSFSNFLTIAARDLDALDAQVAEQRLVHVPLLVERDRHLVDDLEAAPLPDRGLDLLGFVGPDVVLGQDLLDRLQPVLDHRLVVRGAVAPEQVFQDVDRDVRPFLDQLGQVLANDLARRSAGSADRPGRCQALWFQKSSVNALSIITSTLCCSMPVSASRRTRR